MTSASERNPASIYPLIALLVAGLLAAVIPVCLVIISHQAPNALTEPNANSIRSFDQAKRQAVAMTPRHTGRLHLIGGSSSFYGIRAKTLSARLGMPVINNGLHGGLGLDYLLYRARQLVKPGDTVLLVLEYQFYNDVIAAAYQPTLAHYVLRWDHDFLLARPLAYTLALAGKISLAEYADILRETRPAAADRQEVVSRLNSHGDLMSNRLALQRPEQQRALDELQAASHSLDLLTPDAPRIRSFLAWCRERNIRVLAAFPPYLDFRAYRNSESRAFFNALPRFYRRLGVPTLGSPYDSMFPKSMFLDSPYHLHADAADVMTRRIGDRLVKLMPQARVRPPERLQKTLHLDLSQRRHVPGLDLLSGFGDGEDWGRWTDGRARIELREALPERFRFTARVVHVYGGNGQAPTLIGSDGNLQPILIAGAGDICMDLRTTGHPTSLLIAPPHPESPAAQGLNGDTRELGIGLSQVTIEPLPAAAPAACP